MSSVDVLWRRADGTGHDACSLTRSDAGWQVHGATVWAHDRKPAWLSYHMTSDQAWNVQAARLRGIVGGAPVDLSIRRRADGLWGMNGRGLPGSETADDLELCVTPACRLFTLRRVMGQPGAVVDLQTVSLHRENWGLQPMARTLRRVDATHWRLIGADGQDQTMKVDQYGFATECDEIWFREVTD